MRIAVIEDEGLTALFLKETIEACGHEVAGVFDSGEPLWSLLATTKIDLVMMDIQIKGAYDGLQVARRVRRKYPDLAIIFLTSFKDSETIEEASEVRPLGYLIKPISPSDIEAILMVANTHIRSVLPLRQPSEHTRVISYRGYRYDTKTSEIYDHGRNIALTHNEQLCLRALMQDRNGYVSIEYLIASIWDDGQDHRASLRELIYRLRRKLPGLSISSIPNVGYRIEWDETDAF